MKKRRIIFIVSLLAGICLSIAILYPFLVKDFKNTSGVLIITGAFFNFIIAVVYVSVKVKEKTI
mgnify:CR=1 FL=1